MHVLIIGASSGIGRQLSLQYAHSGHKVKCVSRRSGLLKELNKEFSENITIASIDVSNTVVLPDSLDALCVRDDPFDLIIHCAAIVEDNPDLEDSIEKRTIATNVTGFVLICNWAYRTMAKRGSGHYAAITSVFGSRGRRLAPSYNASKAFQINYLEGLRQKAVYDKVKITITDLRPGFVKTDMGPDDNSGLPVISAEKAARIIVKGIRKRRKVLRVPKYYIVFEWILKLLPARIWEGL